MPAKTFMPVDIPNGLYYYYRGYWWLFLLKRLGTGLRKNYLVVWDRGEIFSVSPVRGGEGSWHRILFCFYTFSLGEGFGANPGFCEGGFERGFVVSLKGTFELMSEPKGVCD